MAMDACCCSTHKWLSAGSGCAASRLSSTCCALEWYAWRRGIRACVILHIEGALYLYSAGHSQGCTSLRVCWQVHKGLPDIRYIRRQHEAACHRHSHHARTGICTLNCVMQGRGRNAQKAYRPNRIFRDSLYAVDSPQERACKINILYNT